MPSSPRLSRSPFARFAPFALLALCASQIAVSACVKRPPPIVSPPVLPAATAASPCTMANGIDPRGDPSCSEGCQWDRAQKACAPLPGAPASPPPSPSPAPPSPPADSPPPAATDTI